MKFETLDSYGGGRQKVLVSEGGPRSTRHYTGHCQEHSGHKLLEPESVVVETGGFEWTPQDGLVISYCEECIDEERSYDQKDDPPAAVVADLISSGTRWRRFREFFEPRSLAEGLELTHCPYCGDEFTQMNQQNGRATCAEHGPLKLTVRQLEVM